MLELLLKMRAEPLHTRAVQNEQPPGLQVAAGGRPRRPLEHGAQRFVGNRLIGKGSNGPAAVHRITDIHRLHSSSRMGIVHFVTVNLRIQETPIGFLQLPL